MGTISVCMATYNGQSYITEQLMSILNQLGNADEIIISDDSSKDETVDIIRSLEDSRIRIYAGQKFRNPIFNFENAIRHATGDHLFLSDQDDVWLPGKVEKMLLYLKNHDLVVSDCKVVDSKLNVIHDSYFSLINAKPGFIRNFVRTSPYIGCCMAFNRSILNKILPFPKHIPMHDFWIAMVAELKYNVYFLHEPLILYRRHSNTASMTGESSNNPLWKRVMFRARILFALISQLNLK